MNKKINCISQKDILLQKVSQTLRYVKSIQPILYLYYEKLFFWHVQTTSCPVAGKIWSGRVESVLEYKSIYNR